jgi:hypothetical protein
LLYRDSDRLFHGLSEVTGDCHANLNNNLPAVKPSQSIQGQWVYFAVSWNSPSQRVYQCYRALTDTAHCFSIADTRTRLLWNTSASFNRIYLGAKYYDCQAQYTFTDVRAYVNSALDSAQQEAVLTQMSALCTSDCSVCSSPIACQTCADGFVALSGGCVACSGTCKTCSGSTSNQCSSCYEETYLSSTECVRSCPDGYYPDSALWSCVVCSSMCKTCRNPTECLSCSDALYSLVTSSMLHCIGECPAQYFYERNTCSTCNAKCSGCLGLQAQSAWSVQTPSTKSMESVLSAKKASTSMTHSARNATVLVRHATPLPV